MCEYQPAEPFRYCTADLVQLRDLPISDITPPAPRPCACPHRRAPVRQGKSGYHSVRHYGSDEW